MSLPVSQYEALLAEVRNLKHKAQKVQQLANPLISNCNTSRIISSTSASYSNNFHYQNDKPLDYTMESLLFRRQRDKSNSPPNYDGASSSSSSSSSHHQNRYHYRDLEFAAPVASGAGGGRKPTSTYSQISVSSEPVPRLTPQNDHDSWSKKNMWNSEPASLGTAAATTNTVTAVTSATSSSQPYNQQQQQQRIWNSNGNSCPNDASSVISFASSSGAVPLEQCGDHDGSTNTDDDHQTKYNLRTKMDVVHGLLSMLGNQEHVDMGETLLALSTCPESCMAMRQSGCISLLVQLVQSDKDCETRRKAGQALHNLVNSQTDQKSRKREIRILTLLESARTYIECLKNNTDGHDVAAGAAAAPTQPLSPPPTVEQPSDDGGGSGGGVVVDDDKHPVQTIAHLMKLSFDENHRQAICQLGGIHTIAKLVEMEHYLHTNSLIDSQCILMRRYSCMALTNLTFGDSGNKALLCSFKEFMTALIVQLESPSDELRQVTASVLRNLSWRADSTSKEILREKHTVTALIKAAMLSNKENTLKSILSALWNLSAHCTDNKSEICSMDGALAFLVSMLTYKTPSKSWAIIENAGGILRNISSQIALRDDYREILRQHNCLQILLDQLKSASLTIVSNACGTLWNLSAKNAQDQEALWQMGAPALLRSLNHSKHKMIAMGSSAALKNLLTFKPNHFGVKQHLDSTALSLNLSDLPTLGMRKQKALMKDLDQSLSETYENIEKESSPPIKLKNESKKLNINEFLLESKTSKQQHSDHQSNLANASSGAISDLNNAFYSLNLNEPISSNYCFDTDKKTRLSSHCYNSAGGSFSLPYNCNSSSAQRYSNPNTFLPIRSKYRNDDDDGGGDRHREDDNASSSKEQPLDYSKKYAEMKRFQRKEQQQNDNEAVGYSESGLDQLTDYSLKYAENETDDLDICNKMITKQEFVQDTVKTYYTENTPYETPYIISNATSMSDLRNIEQNDDDDVDDRAKCPNLIDNDLQTNKMLETKPPEEVEVKHVDDDEEKDRCSTEDISVKIDVTTTANTATNATVVPPIDIKPMLKFNLPNSSGIMSPEKPINYCEEGTPGYFSRVSSFGSGLDLIEPESEPVDARTSAVAPTDFEVKKEEDELKEETACAIETRDELLDVEEKEECLSKNEMKVVKFEQSVDYAEETPLVFSRSSSLGSLDSIEQHSIHDDRSSIVSDFSRLTSGVVSPSELPDSPTQTIPPSPRPPPNIPLPRPPINTADTTTTTPPTTSSSSNRVSTSRKQGEGGAIASKQQLIARQRHSGVGGGVAVAAGVLPKHGINTRSVFEDNVRKFKQENTPIDFSTTTSLSSLLIDDENYENHLSVVNNENTDVLENSSSNDVEKKKNVKQEEKGDEEKDAADVTGSDNDISEGDENILAACINEGMQLNISSLPTANSASSKLSSISNFKYASTIKSAPGSTTGTGIPQMRRTPPRKIPAPSTAVTTAAAAITTTLDDAPKTYCTEDTPAELSRMGSNSNLSTLSFLNDNKSSNKLSDFSDESSNLSSGENDNILLAQCIQSAMPVAKQAQVHRLPNLNNSKHFPSALPRYNMQSPLKRYPVQNLSSHPSSVEVASSSTTSQMYERQPPAAKSNEQAVKEKKKKAVLPPYLLVNDELESYVVEDSPYQFSLKSSLSDLTIDHDTAAGGGGVRKRDTPIGGDCSGNAIEPSTEEVKAKESPSSRDSSEEQALLEECIYAGMPIDKHEEALLKECIQAGMPKSTINSDLVRIGANQSTEQGRSFMKQQSSSLSSSKRGSGEVTLENQLVGNTSSKNVKVASVAGITANDHHPDMSITTVAAGVEDIASNRNDTPKNVFNNNNSELIMDSQIMAEEEEEGAEVPHAVAAVAATVEISSSVAANTIGGTVVDVYLADNYLKSEDNCSTVEDQMKNGSKTVTATITSTTTAITNTTTASPQQCTSDNDLSYSDSDNCANIDNVFAKSCEESGNLMDNRMLDPDAMIESLDRFTAKLVSQASHLTNNNNNETTANITDSQYENNTWNEDDTLTNTITLGSISGMPNVITFGSEIDDVAVDGEDEKQQVLKDESLDNNDIRYQYHHNIINPSSKIDETDGIIKTNEEEQSLDFSSIPTQTTMTASTLIAIEANRMAKAFKLEAEMSQSITSVASLCDLDEVQPPSQLNSLITSSTPAKVLPPKSPRLLLRKKSLPSGSYIKQALTSSFNNHQAFGSLENNLNLENSAQNGPHPIFDVKQPFVIPSTNLSSSLNTSDLDLVNPPSLFNEVTDLCGSASLADVPTEVIGTEISIFEDCLSQVDNTLQDEQTNFSDANSTTPIQTDQSSAEGTPTKKLPVTTTAKPLSKSMMTKQRRNQARDRYKTYTVAVEMVMQESIEMEMKSKHQQQPEIDDQNGSLDTTYVVNEVSTTTAPEPLSAEANSSSKSSSGNSTPTRTKKKIRKDFLQKRQENKERFKTQILNDSISLLHSATESPSPPPPPLVPTSICNNVNDIHYLVQQEADLVLKTLKDNSYLQDEMLDCETLSLVSNDEETEQLSVGSLGSTQMFSYKTYHKSWGTTRPNLPIVDSNHQPSEIIGEQPISDTPPELPSPAIVSSDAESSSPTRAVPVPKGSVKIVKSIPRSGSSLSTEQQCDESNIKAIRGRRKPLYSKSNTTTKISPKMIKPAKTMNSTIVTNVTSTFKRSGASLKNIVANKEQPTIKMTHPNKPVLAFNSSSNRSKPKSSGYGYRGNNASSTPSRAKSATVGVVNKNATPLKYPATKGISSLERQGTFTKDEASGTNATKATTTKIPTVASKIPSLTVNGKGSSKIATSVLNRGGANSKIGIMKSVSSDRANRNPKVYNRSTSADCRDPTKRIQPSSSTHSLKSEATTTKPHPTIIGMAKRSIPIPSTQRCASNASLASTGSGSSTTGAGGGGVKKHINSKIASLWKKVEESKVKQQTQKDKRIWIQNGIDQKPSSTENQSATNGVGAAAQQLIRSNTFENKGGLGLLLKNKPHLPPALGPPIPHSNGDDTVSVKRVSRLGSYLVNGQENGFENVNA